MASRFGGQYAGVAGGRRAERDRVLVMGVLAFVVALLLVTLAVIVVKGTDQKAAQVAPIDSGVGQVTLFVPERRVSAGTKLSEVEFKPALWSRNQVPGDAIRDLAELQGFYAKIDIVPGMPITREYLTKAPQPQTLPLTPGNRAVSIEVDDTAGLEGHALPGTRVDVVLTFYEDNRLVSKVIVQNARVLSYGGDAKSARERGVDSGARRTSRTITLDVSPRDALQVSTARQLGRLSLIMRASDDEKAPSVLEVNQDDLRDTKVEKSRQRACKTGRMRMGGKDYVVDCDGSLSEIADPNE